MAKHRGWVERFHDDQLIVALPDLDVVTGALADLGAFTPTRAMDRTADPRRRAYRA